MSEVLERHPDWARLQRAINRLRVMPHVNAAPLERSARSSEHPGGRRPAGGIDWLGDRDLNYRQKSHVFFERRRQGLQTAVQLTALCIEAECAVEAWRRTLIPDGQPPAPGDPQWKRWVAESDLGVGELARLFNVPRQYIHRIRKGYRQEAA